jgi:quinol monooxygenase YgiN
MTTVTVVAKLTFAAHAVHTVVPELTKLVAATRSEEGCLEYRLHQDNDDPALFIFYENWKSQACLDRHLESAHFKSYVAAVGHLINGRVLHTHTEVG